GNATSGLTKEVIAYNLRSSRYNTFAEKMSAVTAPEDLWDIATGYITVIGQRFNAEETFDKFEIEGDASFTTLPLVTLKAGLNNAWLRDDINPMLYNNYPLASGVTLERKNGQKWGLPPLDAVMLYNNDVESYKLEASNVSDGIALTKPG